MLFFNILKDLLIYINNKYRESMNLRKGIEASVSGWTTKSYLLNNNYYICIYIYILNTILKGNQYNIKEEGPGDGEYNK